MITKYNYINITKSVTAAFTASTVAGLVPLVVNFTDQSTGPVSSWLWDFGDGTTSTLQNPSHTYSTSGFRTVTLTVSTVYAGDTDTMVKSNYIFAEWDTPTKIYYAVEVTTSTAVTDSAFGCATGTFRFITDRPGYGITAPYPVYGPNEIDLVGNDIGDDDNTNIYYEDFLLKESISSNPQRAIDITACGSYGNDSSFGFAIRGDAISGTAFWEFCEENDIILTNSVVRFYTVINDVFYQQWRGIVTNTPYTETEFKFECKDEAKILHKNLPPVIKKVVTDARTVPITTEDVTIPVVIGDNLKTPVRKLSAQNEFIQLTGVSGIEPNWKATLKNTKVCAAMTYVIISSTGSNPMCTISLLTQGKNFAANELKDLYLNVASGDKADTDHIYKITKSYATYKFTANYGPFDVTVIELDALLLDKDGGLVSDKQFNSNETQGYVPSSTEAHAFCIGKKTDANGTHEPHSSTNTWWFQISSYQVQTSVSNAGVTFSLNNKGMPVLWSYDENTGLYTDLASNVILSADGSTISLISNTATADGQIQKVEDIGLPIIKFGYRGDPQMYTFPTAPEIELGNDADIPILSDKSRLTLAYIPKLPQASYAKFYGKSCYVFVRYNLTKSIADYDTIYFLCDLVLTNDMNKGLQFGSSQYAVLDEYGRRSCLNSVGGTTNPYLTVNSMDTAAPWNKRFNHLMTANVAYDVNMIPNDFYAADKIGTDNVSFYLASLGTDLYNAAYSTTETYYPNRAVFDLSKTSSGIEVFAQNDKYSAIECYQYLYCADSFQGLHVAIKQATLLGVRTIDTITGDLYTQATGELTGATATDPNHPTNDVYHTYMHILEDYDKIPSKLVDYGNLPLERGDFFKTRADWHIGRTLTEQRNSIDYLTELSAQSFIALFGGRTGKRTLRAWSANTPTVSTHTGKLSMHDDSVIIDGSITDYTKTDISKMYNSFLLNYNYDPVLDKFTKSFGVDKIDQTAFPEITVMDPTDPTTPLWKTYGIGIDSYGEAKSLWTTCHNSYLSNRVVSKAQNDISDLYWYIDRAEAYPEVTVGGGPAFGIGSSTFATTGTYGSGSDAAAFKFLKILAEWTTRQKDLVTYSIPLTPDTVETELLDVINFQDTVITKGLTRVGWIVSVEIDAANDCINLQAILEPADMLITYDIVERGVLLNTDTITEGDHQANTITEDGA